ncbi:MAG: hypothetical protein KDA93_17055 [Planctomycetaceae bacterium]|nr:hypothetical protein [Planctomycetaceae bacterium]
MKLWPVNLKHLSRWTPRRRRKLGALSISAVVHVTLALVCGQWLLSDAARPSPLAVETVWSETLAEESLNNQPLQVTPDDQSAGGDSLGQAIFLHTNSAATNDGITDLQEVGSLDFDQTDAPVPQSLTHTVGLAGGQGAGVTDWEGSGAGDGAAQGDGEGNSTFFGMPVDGRRIVYVVDASRSMNRPYPGPMLTRFGRVKLELVRSIRRMTPEQHFFIVYFNDHAIPMPARTMMPALPGTQGKYLHWAAQAKADGHTDPEQALLLALMLRPDLIYFLTDGDFSRKVIEQVTQSNQSRVVIHTIGFGDDKGENLLKQLAAKNWGDYQFIHEDDPQS